jgi:hypothetical protein
VSSTMNPRARANKSGSIETLITSPSLIWPFNNDDDDAAEALPPMRTNVRFDLLLVICTLETGILKWGNQFQKAGDCDGRVDLRKL